MVTEHLEPRLTLRRSCQQGHSAPYRTGSRLRSSAMVLISCDISNWTSTQAGLPPSGDAAGGLLRSWALFYGAYSYPPKSGGAQFIIVSSMDSDLEAFSHNPSDGSFSPLTFQSSEMTNYHIQRFLSYYVALLLRWHSMSISRVKLTCLTTV